ncbi:tyrosine-type recombinase/integrase [Arcticibacter tournemirensis]
MNTDFAKHLELFMTNYLINERGLAPNSVQAYRDAIVLLLEYMNKAHGIRADRLEYADLTCRRVEEWLDWLEKERGCCANTRNQRLALLRSFFSYLMYKHPDRISEWQHVMSIRPKKPVKKGMKYLTADGVRLFLEQPDRTTARGYRDTIMLTLAIDSGARVQELLDLTPSCINLGKITTLRIYGKGRKVRTVPLSSKCAAMVKEYLRRLHLDNPEANMYPLFGNGHHSKLTRTAVTAIVKKYAAKARLVDSQLIPDHLSPHSLRHTKGMLLQEADVNIFCIRDFLGHSSINTTEIYARASVRQKKEALEKTSVTPYNDVTTSWQKDRKLLDWLKDLGKRQDIM